MDSGTKAVVSACRSQGSHNSKYESLPRWVIHCGSLFGADYYGEGIEKILLISHRTRQVFSKNKVLTIHLRNCANRFK
jgi:hypothetical protein